jgi:hypothetical protein
VTQRHKHLNKRLATSIHCHNHVNRMSHRRHIKCPTKCNATFTLVTSISILSNNDVSTSQGIHSIRMLYNDIYDIVCLINYHFGIKNFVMSSWILIEVVLTGCLYVLIFEYTFICNLFDFVCENGYSMLICRKWKRNFEKTCAEINLMWQIRT